MNWYLAKLVFRIVCGDGKHSAQFDEQLRLVAGRDRDDAFLKACEIARKEEDSFYNRKEQLVRWEFINVSELYQLQGLTDGMELYSRIEERENAEVYVHTVHQKAKSLKIGKNHPELKPA